MKSRLFVSMFGVLVMITFNVAHADARSELSRCQSNAEAAYDACKRMTNNAGETSPNCEPRYDRKMDSCMRRYDDRTESESRGAKYDSSGRFTPQQIPQRKIYMLPGMR